MQRLSAVHGAGSLQAKIGMIATAVTILLVLYYPLGMLWRHAINDDTAYTVPEKMAVDGGSRAVSMVNALVDREINETPWVANDPWFVPSAVLDNMPNFQQGIVYAASRFVIEMADQVGRTRGSSQVDPDLDTAAGRIKFSGNIWVWDPKVSWMPQASSESQYRDAIKALARYNTRLGEGNAVFDRRADNLMEVLQRIAADVGSASATIETGIAEGTGGLFDLRADDIFYGTKGRLYAYYMILRELGIDFEAVIAERNVGGVWQQMLDSFRVAAELRPIIVSNTDTDDLLFNTHLAVQGFYLLRARTQLREVVNVLLK